MDLKRLPEYKVILKVSSKGTRKFFHILIEQITI